jgi:hypothetical protein
MPKGKSDSTLSRTRWTSKYLSRAANVSSWLALLAVAFVPELLASEPAA